MEINQRKKIVNLISAIDSDENLIILKESFSNRIIDFEKYINTETEGKNKWLNYLKKYSNSIHSLKINEKINFFNETINKYNAEIFNYHELIILINKRIKELSLVEC